MIAVTSTEPQTSGVFLVMQIIIIIITSKKNIHATKHINFNIYRWYKTEKNYLISKVMLYAYNINTPSQIGEANGFHIGTTIAT